MTGQITAAANPGRQAARRGLRRSMTVAVLLAAAWALVPPAAFAQAGAQASSAAPAGLWRSIDDETKQPKALIRISDNGGVLSGRIEKILTDRADALCDACEGELKGKPVLGMTILQGLKAGETWYEGGTILDPNNGKVYKARLRTIEGGARLEVRGFIGVALLGRTQTWLREP